MAPAQQNWQPERYLEHARFVPELGHGVLAWLNPQPGERVLDLGCGEGLLSAAIGDAGAGVVGIDASAQQVEAARRRGLEAHVMDGRDFHFDQPFDAVFSNAALHWMAPLDAVFQRVFAALKPGGRFIAEMGGAGNVETLRQALHAALERRGIAARAHDPWTFPSPGEARTRLEGAGFTVERAERFARPTELPGELGRWLETFAGPFLMAVAVGDRPALMAEVAAQVTAQLRGGDGIWRADYVRLRFAARRPEAGVGS